MISKDFPITITDENVEFRYMTAQDRNAIVNLAQSLTESDLWFLRRDITQLDAIDDWIYDIERHHATTILAEYEGKVIGYGTIYYNQLFWNRHVAEIRVMVSSAHRNRGLGKKLVLQLVLLTREMGLEKVISYMAVDDQGARRLFEDLGFVAEAVLGDWVKTRDNRTRDLLIMSLSLLS